MYRYLLRVAVSASSVMTRCACAGVEHAGDVKSESDNDNDDNAYIDDGNMEDDDTATAAAADAAADNETSIDLDNALADASPLVIGMFKSLLAVEVRFVFNSFFYVIYLLKPSIQICNPACLVPVPSQDKLEGCDRKGIWRKVGG